MDVLPVVLPIAIGALIGYCTNYIAIKMLFRPRKEVRIGSWRVPFTPGVIPKNQGRIAKAVGAAVSGSLLTQEDLNANLPALKETLVDRIQDALTEQAAPLSALLPQREQGDLVEDLSQLASKKILSGLKRVDMEAIISDVVRTSFGDLLANPMVAMFLGGSMLDSICEKLGLSIGDYIDQKGPAVVEPLVREELDGMLAKPIRENLDDLGIPEEVLRNLLNAVVGHVLDENLPSVFGSLDVQAVVEAKVNAMDARQLEELVLSVMKQELQAVINLGAIIGAVIGTANLLL